MRDCINEILNVNCLLTLQQINEELRRRLPAKPLVCDRTIGKAMDRMLISVKMARTVPAARNRPDVIERSSTTASSLMNVATTSGQREVMEGRELGNVLTVKFQVNVAEMRQFVWLYRRQMALSTTQLVLVG